MDSGQEMESEANRVRRSGALGRSGPLGQLFDYLVVSALAGRRLTEMDIAADVFGKPEGFDLSLDATVRVYVHRLRRKLADFYATAGSATTAQLVIPKGEYRIGLSVPPQDAAVTRTVPSRMIWRFAAFALVMLLVNGLVWWAVWPSEKSAGFVQARTRAPWTQLFADDRPITIVVGDYYIFREIDTARGVDRLIRDYAINSLDDLDRYLMNRPDLRGRYQDLNLTYLPQASAFALREILPLIVRADHERIGTRVVTASQLTPMMLKVSHIVYVGYFSGLGALRNAVFAGSRFSIGDTWDDLIDERTGRRFSSAEGGPGRVDVESRDYGYVSSFEGPGGNRIIVIAGARDMGVRQAAEALTRIKSLDDLAYRTRGARDFEALYEAHGIDRQNLQGSLLIAAPMLSHSGRPKIFPAR